MKKDDMSIETSGVKSRQWTLLAALTAGHFVVDCFPGTMHTILPKVQSDFAFNLSSGASLLMYFLLAANGIQVVIGHLRPEKTRPLFLYIGLACSLCLGAFIMLPRQASSFWPAVAILFICGAGVGMSHPEFMRAVHTLDGISSAVSTSIFMAGGVGGFAFGGWAATAMVQRWGFEMLWLFCIMSIVVMVILWALRVQLACEGDHAARKDAPIGQVSFWPVFVMAVLGGCSSSVVVWAVPQALAQFGFELNFGGYSVMLFSLAGGIGGIVVSRLAARKGELITCLWMLLAGIPFGFLYAEAVTHRWASWLIALLGLLCYGAYPLMVSMARQAGGANLGQRMGFIIGGTWLITSFVPRLLAPVAERWGLKVILLAAPLGYLAAATLAGYLWIQIKRKKQHDAI